jgi:hypothetical protein
MFYRLKQAFYRFMYGRYGNDALNNFLTVFYLILVVFNLLLGSYTVYLSSLVLIFIIFFRMLSRNIDKRRKENQKFLNIKYRFTQFFKERSRRFKERKTHVYKSCPACKATLRLPRKKGKHTCCCPKCKNSFKVRVF